MLLSENKNIYADKVAEIAAFFMRREENEV